MIIRYFDSKLIRIHCQKAIASHDECKDSVDRPDSDHEKRCIMDNKEHKRQGEKETDTSADTELKEHHSDDRECDEMHRFTKNKTAHTLEDSVAELFHQGIS